MARQHTSKQTLESKQVVAKARANANAVCWWCGERPLSKRNKYGGRFELWEADHISPTVKGSPLAAACQRCNRGRHGKMVDSMAIQRLCHSPNVVLHINATHKLKHNNDVGLAVAEWLKSASIKVFGNANHVDIILSASPSKKMTREDENGKVCDAWYENKLAKEAGLAV